MIRNSATVEFGPGRVFIVYEQVPQAKNFRIIFRPPQPGWPLMLNYWICSVSPSLPLRLPSWMGMYISGARAMFYMVTGYIATEFGAKISTGTATEQIRISNKDLNRKIGKHNSHFNYIANNF